MSSTANSSWSDAELKTIQTLWGEGYSASQIAVQLPGRSRSAVLGKVHRMKLGGRAGHASSHAPRPPRPPRAPRANKPRVAKPARAVKPKPIAPVELPVAPLPRSAAWDALEGSSPVALEFVTGCRWPIGDDPMLFCNCEKVEGASYCDRHNDLALRKGRA